MTQEQEIRERIARHLNKPEAQIDWNAGLDSVGLGSLQFVEIFVDLQEAFSVSLFHEDMDCIECLNDLVRILDGRLQHGPAFGGTRRDVPEEIAVAARI